MGVSPMSRKGHLGRTEELDVRLLTTDGQILGQFPDVAMPLEVFAAE
jgi:hypothetical protein